MNIKPQDTFLLQIGDPMPETYTRWRKNVTTLTLVNTEVMGEPFTVSIIVTHGEPDLKGKIYTAGRECGEITETDRKQIACILEIIKRKCKIKDGKEKE